MDGTENPTGNALYQAALISDEDADFAGGAYVAVQKYLHNLTAWGALSVSEQEGIIGRTKADDIELLDVHGRKSHRSLTTIVDAHGIEHDILRDNMPFGRPGQAEFGTYFIGYSRDLSLIEQMIRNMFVGDPAGEYDRILDFSTAAIGTSFFIPSNDLLKRLGA